MLHRLRVVLCLVLVLVLAPPSASGHGDIPLVTSVSVRPGHPAELVASTTFGALVSRDGGEAWDLVCELVLSSAAAGDPRMLFGDDGALWAASSVEGVSVSRDGGCSFQAHPDFQGRYVTSLVLHPGSPGTLLATLGEPGVPGALLVSDDGGVSFEPTALAAEDDLYTAACASAASPTRLYVSALTGSKARLYASDDVGKTFTSSPVAEADGGAFAVLGASPVDEDVVFVFAGQDTEDRVLRSTNGGADLAPVLTVSGSVRGLEHSADGTKVWVAATRLYGSEDGGATFAPYAGPTLNACIGRAGEALFACGWEQADGWSLGISHDGGATWQPAVALATIRGVLDCPAGTDTTEVCPASWLDLKSQLGGGGGGAPVPAEPVEPAPPAPEPPGSGCGAVPRASGAAAAVVVGVMLFVLAVSAARPGKDATDSHSSLRAFVASRRRPR